jgi:hypothetical protein
MLLAIYTESNSLDDTEEFCKKKEKHIMNKHIIEGIRRAYDAFSRGDVQGAVDAVDLDPDILWIEPEDFHAGGTYRGRQGVAEYLTLSREPFEKAQSLPEEILEVCRGQDRRFCAFPSLAEGRRSADRRPDCRCLYGSGWEGCADASLQRPRRGTQSRWAFALPLNVCLGLSYRRAGTF